MKKGFTLFEFLIVILIIGILAPLSFQSLAQGRKQLTFENSLHLLLQEIIKAREMAMAMREVDGIFPNGFGIYIDKANLKIYLFADISSPYDQYDTKDKIIEDFCKIEKAICQKKIAISSLYPPGNILQIVFRPPYPTAVINKNQANLEAKISLSDGKNQKTIKINKIGLITIE